MILIALLPLFPHVLEDVRDGFSRQPARFGGLLNRKGVGTEFEGNRHQGKRGPVHDSKQECHLEIAKDFGEFFPAGPTFFQNFHD